MNEVIEDLKYEAKIRPFVDVKKFFKTRNGEYACHDIFLGCYSDAVKRCAKKYSGMDPNSLRMLIQSPFHEARMCALLILRIKIKNKSLGHDAAANFFLDNLEYINNWDLVDNSAPHILGMFLFETKNFDLLYNLSQSENLWARRVSVISTLYFVRNGLFMPSLKIIESLLSDKEDLIHKASGWVLREIGKRDEKILCEFLSKHKKSMPRTTLRYAIERFPAEKRKNCLLS